MTDPLSLTIAGAAAAVALVAGWMQWPRPPDLDGERWFKVMLATVLRGEVEAAGGSSADWEAAVLRFVPYHPAGRLPERKVKNPVAARLPGAHLPGERALLEALARKDSLVARWAFMYDEDPIALDARLDDPVELGPAYDPAPVLGVGWDALAAWGAGDPAFLDALRRRFKARWVLVDGRPPPIVLPALADILGGDAERIPFSGGGSAAELDDAARALAERLRGLLPTREVRLVLVAEEAGVALVLRALASAADVRDQVDAVVSLGGVIGGLPDTEGPLGERDAEDWLGAHFTQAGLDTEVVRLTPYLSVQWLDREAPVIGAGDLPIASQRFPTPREDDAMETVETVDLGVLPWDPALPVAQVARALVATVGCWVLSRR